MAVFLPVVAVLIAGGGPMRIFVSVGIAVVTTVLVLVVAIRYGGFLSGLLANQSDETILFTVLGSVLLVAIAGPIVARIV